MVTFIYIYIYTYIYIYIHVERASTSDGGEGQGDHNSREPHGLLCPRKPQPPTLEILARKSDTIHPSPSPLNQTP